MNGGWREGGDRTEGGERCCLNGGVLYREEQHVDCDRRLETEMGELRARTAVEIDQLKAQTREMYERENKVLSEARDAAMREREGAKAAEKEANEKFESLMME